jgi:cytochrome c-type biogenesis protein CcmE
VTDLSPRTSPETAAPPAKSRRRWLSIIVLCAVLVAGGVIVTQFLRSAVDYYCNVDEVGRRSGCDADRRLRLQGVVQQGSIVHDGGDTDFVIAFNGASVPVQYDGEPGGIFKECIPVVVHGKFASATGVFEGDLVEVKHSDEYVAVNDDRLAEAEDLAAACDAAGS